MKNRGADKKRWWSFHHDWKGEEGEVIEEVPLTIYVNGLELVTI